MGEYNSKSSDNNKKANNKTNRGGRGKARVWRGRGIGGIGHGRSGGSSYTIHNNRNKWKMEELGKNVFEVTQSEKASK